jgi:hypothetical protein
MKNIIKCKKIDTGSHAYLSISKKEFLLSGLTPSEISAYSGHTFSKIYLAEDCDATLFRDACEKKGIQLIIKTIHNSQFKIGHNYNPELFDYAPKINDIIIGYNNCNYTIINKNEKGIMINDKITNKKYFILISNPFMYIKNVIK